MTRPQFLILDQSLKDADGHHYDMDRYVAAAALNFGLAPRVASHRAYDARLPFDGTPVDPWFSQNWVDAHQPKAVQIARRAIEMMPRVLRAPTLAVAGTARRILSSEAQTPHAPRFGAEALAYLHERGVTDHDHIFIHTLAGAELLSLCDTVLNLKASPRIHVVLRRDATEPVMNRGVPGGIAGLLARIAHTPHLRSRIRLFTDTELLTAQHRALQSELTITTLPIPIPPMREILACDPRSEGPFRLVYLGNARVEKGFQELPSAARALTHAAPALPSTQLIAQANSAVSLFEEAIDAARNQLRTMGATLIERPLDTEEYAALLASADLVLLPYKAEDYRRRSSGILVQALAAGKPVVVPNDCWLSDTAPSASSVSFGGDVEFASAVVTAVGKLDALSAAAHADAPRWRQAHSPKRLVEALLASD